MNISGLILKRLARNKSVTAAEIMTVTGYSQPYINRFFTRLIEEGLVLKAGRGRNTYYVNPGAGINKDTMRYSAKLVNKRLSESDVFENISRETGIFFKIKKEVISLVNYAFTEILNNAIEHSDSSYINILMERKNGIIRFDVVDRGIGIFNNIRRKYRLGDTYEAINELLKGKRTTMPEKHSGEGIFFTSKAADTFVIQSSGKKLFFNNLVNDVFLSETRPDKGTRVVFTVSEKSRKSLKKIFDNYTDDNFSFTKTKIFVKLYKIGDEFISRSQARRILFGLESFNTIILDFKNVNFIGQGFADEVFRVYSKANPKKRIEYTHANKDVEFMIKRAM